MTAASISPAELLRRCQSGSWPELIDVRTPSEFRDVHVSFARNIPLDQLDPRAVIAGRQGDSAEPLYVTCQAGGRGKTACERLAQAGLTNVVNVAGGTLACVEAGLPVVHGPKGFSLERQVRIVAGLLVFAGAALGWFVHPAWVGLAAFVGAGLVFAGVTNKCGMALLLLHMPWNRSGGAEQACCAGSAGKNSGKECLP